METARPSWTEIAAIIEEGSRHFAGTTTRSDWTAAEQLAVVLAPEVFGPEIRQLLVDAEDRLPEVEVILAQDADAAVLETFAKLVLVTGVAETAERLLVENGGVKVARILATSRSLSGGAQMAIAETLNGDDYDHWSRRMMLFAQEVISPGVLLSLTGDALYRRDAPEWHRKRWDPVVARLLVEAIHRYPLLAEHLRKRADVIEASLAEYVEDTGDDSWQGDEFLEQPPPDIEEGGAAS